MQPQIGPVLEGRKIMGALVPKGAIGHGPCARQALGCQKIKDRARYAGRQAKIIGNKCESERARA
jgi:hypothetical protein